jgi:sugar phosphate isomerase/epimerase
MTNAEFIQRASQWECDCIEMLDTNLFETDPPHILRWKREAFVGGLELSGLSVYTDFIRPESSAAKAEVTRIKKWVDRAALMGAPLLVVFPGSAKRGTSLVRSMELVAEAMKRLSDHATKQGVILGLENHGMFTEDAAAVLRIVETVDHPWVGANLDTGNFKKQPYENMALLAPKAVNCHLKLDVKNVAAREPVDLPRIVQILRGANYRGRVVVQYELDGDPLVEVPKYLRQFRGLLEAS